MLMDAEAQAAVELRAPRRRRGNRLMLLDVGASVLRLLRAESARRTTLKLLAASAPLLPDPALDDARLSITALGRRFPNPIGLAAGFDKDAEVPNAMLKLGFGFVECGTVTPLPQEGNPTPRIFRLREDGAVINRMGFNSAGMEFVAERLSERQHTGIVGINIGANKSTLDKINDYQLVFSKLASLADYVAVNVSSPNTPGLRGLQARDELERLLSSLLNTRERLKLRVPVLVKIAPDIDNDAIDEIADVTLSTGTEGIIVSNTTISRPSSLRSKNSSETGGLSGAPLFEPSTAVLKAVRARVGSKIVLVGVGGISSGKQAYAKIRAGASLVQFYTALAYRGPSLITRIKKDILVLLTNDGFTNIADAVGADFR